MTAKKNDSKKKKATPCAELVGLALGKVDLRVDALLALLMSQPDRCYLDTAVLRLGELSYEVFPERGLANLIMLRLYLEAKNKTGHDESPKQAVILEKEYIQRALDGAGELLQHDTAQVHDGAREAVLSLLTAALTDPEVCSLRRQLDDLVAKVIAGLCRWKSGNLLKKSRDFMVKLCRGPGYSFSLQNLNSLLETLTRDPDPHVRWNVLAVLNLVPEKDWAQILLDGAKRRALIHCLIEGHDQPYSGGDDVQKQALTLVTTLGSKARGIELKLLDLAKHCPDEVFKAIKSIHPADRGALLMWLRRLDAEKTPRRVWIHLAETLASYGPCLDALNDLVNGFIALQNLRELPHGNCCGYVVQDVARSVFGGNEWYSRGANDIFFELMTSYVGHLAALAGADGIETLTLELEHAIEGWNGKRPWKNSDWRHHESRSEIVENFCWAFRCIAKGLGTEYRDDWRRCLWTWAGREGDSEADGTHALAQAAAREFFSGADETEVEVLIPKLLMSKNRFVVEEVVDVARAKAEILTAWGHDLRLAAWRDRRIADHVYAAIKACPRSEYERHSEVLLPLLLHCAAVTGDALPQEFGEEE